MAQTPDEIAVKLDDLEREWITGWKGVGGAAFNVVATGLVAKGLLKGSLDWNLSPLGEQVRTALQKEPQP